MVAAMVTMFTTASFAQSSSAKAPSTPSGQSVATEEAQAPKKEKPPVSIGDFSMFFGPMVKSPLTGESPDERQNSVVGIWSKHWVNAKFDLTPKLTLSPVFVFMGTFTDPNTGGAARGLKLDDPYLQLKRSGLVEAKTDRGHAFNLDGDLRYYAPLSKSARDNSTIGTVRATLTPSIQFADSALGFTMESYAKYWIQPKGNERELTSLKLYTAPQLSYKHSSSATSFVMVEANTYILTSGRNLMNDPAASLIDVQPGVSLNIVKDVLTLSPYLNWYINQPLNTTSVNINADIKML